MKTAVRIIVPVNAESLIEPKVQGHIEAVGVDSEWLLTWVLWQWPLMCNRNDLELYDTLFSQLEARLESHDLEEPQYSQMYGMIEEHIDEFATAAYSIYDNLIPYVGRMPMDHPTMNVMGIEHQNFGKNDMVLNISLEERSECDPSSL